MGKGVWNSSVGPLFDCTAVKILNGWKKQGVPDTVFKNLLEIDQSVIAKFALCSVTQIHQQPKSPLFRQDSFQVLYFRKIRLLSTKLHQLKISGKRPPPRTKHHSLNVLFLTTVPKTRKKSLMILHQCIFQVSRQAFLLNILLDIDDNYYCPLQENNTGKQC